MAARRKSRCVCLFRPAAQGKQLCNFRPFSEPIVISHDSDTGLRKLLLFYKRDYSSTGLFVQKNLVSHSGFIRTEELGVTQWVYSYRRTWCHTVGLFVQKNLVSHSGFIRTEELGVTQWVYSYRRTWCHTVNSFFFCNSASAAVSSFSC